MKVLSFSILFFISSSILATPHQLRGKFSFKGSIKKTSSSVVEPVYAFTSSGRSRLGQLKSDGYTCKAVPRQSYRCKKFDKSFSPRPSSLERIKEELSWETLEFIGEQGRPYIDNEGEVITFYKVDGKVKFMGEVFEQYDYWVIDYGDHQVHKLILRGSDRHEFIVNSEESLSRVKTFSNQEKKRFFRFIYQGEFSLF